MKDLAAGLNAKFKFTYTSLIFVACNAEPVTRGIGSGGVMHTNQIKPLHAVRTHSALRHGALFGWADSATNFGKRDKHALPLWMIYYSTCYEWSCCKFWHFMIKKRTGAASARIHARTWNAAGYQRRTGTQCCAMLSFDVRVRGYRYHATAVVLPAWAVVVCFSTHRFAKVYIKKLFGTK